MNISITHHIDKFDSSQDRIMLIDNSEPARNHPQGPLVLADVNARAFAPHVELSLSLARVLAAAPDLLNACRLVLFVHTLACEDDGPGKLPTDLANTVRNAITRAETALVQTEYFTL